MPESKRGGVGWSGGLLGVSPVERGHVVPESKRGDVVRISGLSRGFPVERGHVVTETKRGGVGWSGGLSGGLPVERGHAVAETKRGDVGWRAGISAEMGGRGAQAAKPCGSRTWMSVSRETWREPGHDQMGEWLIGRPRSYRPRSQVAIELKWCALRQARQVVACFT